MELDLCERVLCFPSHATQLPVVNFVFLMYSLRILFSICGFVVFVQAKDLSSFLFVLP